MISGTASAISARDFDRNAKDTRDEWTPGAMHHLIKALNGAPVVIVLDKRTGFAGMNVTLGGVRQAPGFGTFEVLVKRIYSDGKTGGCWYPLFQVGTVIELGTSNRWNAIDAYQEERTRAIRKLQAEMVVSLGVKDVYAMPRGAWEARVFNGFVHASFAPEKFNGPVKYTWKRYSSAELAEA